MGPSFLRLGLAALGLSLAACAFDWDGVYGARFGGNAQGGAGASIPVGEVGGSTGTGGAADTGGTPDTGGASAGAGGCTGNLLENPGFEVADRKGFPTGWESLFVTGGGSVTLVTTPPYEGAYSLLVDTTSLKNPPADYVYVLATTQAYAVTESTTLYLSAAVEVTDQFAPIWIAVLFFDSSGGMLGDLSAGSTATVDHLEVTPSSGFVTAGPLAVPVPRLVATARVAIVAGQGVAAYVDSVCLTW